MKQIEITVRLIDKIENAIAKLENKGFKKIRESDVDDIYLSNLDSEIKKENIQEFLKHSVLLRNLKLDGKEENKITYKYKELDINGDVISEQKVNVNCDDLKKAFELIRKKYSL